MKAGSSSGVARKTRAVGMRWIFYALVVIFVVDVLGIAVPIPLFWGHGVEYNVAGGLVVLVAMFVYTVFDSERRVAKLASRLNSQVSSSDASIQSLRRALDESASEAKRRASEGEASVTKVREGLVALQSPLATIQKQVLGVADSTSKLGDGLAAIGEVASNNTKSLYKLIETEAAIRHQQEVFEEDVARVEEEMKKLEGNLTAMDASGGETKTAVEGLSESVSKLEIGLLELKKISSELAGVASETQEAVEDLGKRSSTIEGKFSSVAKVETRVAKLETGLSRVEGRLEKLAKAEAGITRIEKAVAKIQTKVSKPSPVARPSARRARTVRKPARRKPRARAAPEPAQPVPEEVRQLEEGIQETPEPSTEEPEKSQESEEPEGQSR